MSSTRGAPNDNGRRRFVVRYALLFAGLQMVLLVVLRLVLIRFDVVTASTERTIGVLIGQAIAMFALGWWLARWQWRRRSDRSAGS